MASELRAVSCFGANRFIGKSKPTILISVLTRQPNQIRGIWAVIGDDYIGGSAVEFYTLTDSSQPPFGGALTTLVKADEFVNELKNLAENHLQFHLYEKHPDLWKALYCAGNDPKFSEVVQPEMKNHIIWLAIKCDAGASVELKRFSEGVGNTDFKELVELGTRLRPQFGK